MCDYCSWISQVLDKIGAETLIKKKRRALRVDPVIIVHGGAGNIPRYARKFMLDEVKRAAVTAYCDLSKGCSSVDAVERAIRHMESKKYFNCAYGGSLDANGEVVMDAGIMTDDFRAGCVGAVRNIAHPITLAKKVLQQTEHVLMVESGAQKLAVESDIPILSPEKLIVISDSRTSLHEEEDSETEDTRKAQLEPVQIESETRCDTNMCVPGCVIERREEDESVIPETALIELNESPEIDSDFIQVGAVGAVAYDRRKRFASGTSTAGESGKLHGSVSAIGTAIGCGIYVDQGSSVSVSGCDEAIQKYAPAWRISRRLRQKCTLIDDEAIAAVLKELEEETGTSDAGAIVLAGKGIPLVSFRCAHFPWAYCEKGHVYYGSARNEKFSEKIDILERPLDCMCEDSN